MALNRWSLDRLTAWIGTISLLVLFVPMGVYLMQNVSSSGEHYLSERGKSLVKTLAGQIIEPLLLEDRLTLHDVLQKAAATDSEVRYLCIVNKSGDVLVGTPGESYPPALSELWKASSSEVIFYQTADEPLMDVSEPLMGGQLGALHVGISRNRTRQAVNRLLWLMGIVLIAALSVVLIGSRFIMAMVSKPLRQLEQAVSMFPQRPVADGEVRVIGTQEVQLLARGFSDMIRRLELLEQDRAKTQERMIHTERLAALGELTAGLAHEVHNPLDGMLECMRYLQLDADMSDRATKYYPMITDGLQRIARVMKEMLTFARLGRNVSIETCRIVDVLDTSQLLSQPTIRGRSVNLERHIPDDCICMCDPQGLSQTVLNLVLNAGEAPPNGGEAQVKIDVTSDSQWVYTCVEDNGPGVSEELRERVFEPFFTTKPLGKGTGLGLSVSRQLIRAVGGELELSPGPSSLGGAKFVIRLPKAASYEDTDG